MNVGRSAVRVLTPPLVVAALLAVGVRFEPVRQLLVVLADPSSRLTTTAAAASTVNTLSPTLDGPDRGRRSVLVHLEPRITGVPQPTDVAFVPGRAGQAVVLSKLGTAYLTSTDPADTPRAWFTIAVETKSELGLLGIAFHPRFADNGVFYVNATPTRPDGLVTVISRWRVDPTTLAEPHQDHVVLEVPQPYANHDAGQLAFGPDGKLYVGLGDGGYRGDPHGHGQNRATLLGAMLRIDVDRAITDPTAAPYDVPPDNPFVGASGARAELWAIGLRNPWRYSFDARGRLIVGDVGQDTLEEIDVVGRGDNLGWNVREGDACYPPGADCASTGFTDPVWTYGRDAGSSVTGGFEWTAPGPLSGRYVFGDFVSGRLWALVLPSDGGKATDIVALGRFDLSPSTFARTPTGEVWVADLRRGAVYAIVADGG